MNTAFLLVFIEVSFIVIDIISHLKRRINIEGVSEHNS
jgi:CII-binding regulator of phage lambda lysogenization HflD